MKETVFVIPFAGGSSASFFSWKPPENIEFVFVDVPGKGSNIHQPLLQGIPAMVHYCAKYISEYIASHQLDCYFLMGHSMGSLIAFEVTQQFYIEGRVLPKCLILTGTAAPNRLNMDEINIALLDDTLFLTYIREFHLVNDKVINSRLFRRNYLPIIKNDYEALASYRMMNQSRLPIKAYIINGEEDSFLKEDILGWSHYFEAEPEYRWVPGDHFFVLTRYDFINEIVLSERT